MLAKMEISIIAVLNVLISYVYRTWALIFGGAFQAFTALPGLRHFRVLNILAIIGTTYTVCEPLLCYLEFDVVTSEGSSLAE